MARTDLPGAFLRRVCGCLALALTLLLPSSTSAADRVRLQLKWQHAFQFAGYYAAQAQGYYQAAGLEVEIVPATSEEDPRQQVVSGKAEFGVGATDLLLLREQGAPVVVLASIFQHSPQAFMVLKKQGLQSIHDLAGSTVMVEPDSAELLAYLRHEGVPIDRAKLLPHTFDVQDVLSGKVDAMSVYAIDEPFMAERAGRDYLLYSPRAAGIDFYSDNLFTTEAMIGEKPELVRKFLAASLRGWDYAMQHQEELVQLIYEHYSQHRSVDHLRFEARRMEPLLQTKLVEIGHMNPGRWRHITEIYAEMGMLKPDFNLKGFLYDPDPQPRDLTWLYGILGAVASLLVVVTLVAVRFARLSAALTRSDGERARALAEVRAGERKYRSLTESMKDVVWTLDTETMRFLYVSPSIQQLRGFTPEEVIAEPMWGAFTPVQADRMEKAMRERTDELLGRENSQPKFYTDEVEQSCKDGTTVWTEMIQEYYVNDESGHVELRGVTRDISERKQAEEELRQISTHEKTILATIPDIIVEVDNGKVYTWANPAGERFFGPDVVGKKAMDFFVGEQDTLATVQRLFDGDEQVLYLESWQRRRDGAKRLLAWWCHTRKGPLGQVVGAISTARDITERKQAEEQLGASERDFQQLFESMTSGLALHEIILDKAGNPCDYRFLQVNPAFEALTGMKAGMVVGKTVRQVLPQVEPVWIERYGRVALTGEPAAFEDYSHELGRHYQVVAYRPKPKHFAVIVNDVTERKQSEQKRADLERQLQQAQRTESIGRLAGGVAHDFNNMLAVILGHAELALENMDPALPFFLDIQEIQKAAARSADLTRQLLAFARKETVAPRVLDLNDTVAQMLSMLQRLIGENIDLGWQPGADLWEVNVDPSQIDHLLANLCVNARDAITDIGKVTIESGNRTFDEEYCADRPDLVPGDYVMLAVSDSGCGMDEETLTHIFEPFFTTKQLGKGTGLGLATVYGAVKQNHGFIDASSEPSTGTTIRIYLPRHVGGDRQPQVAGNTEPPRRGQETILLAEDEPAVLKMATAMLKGQGYTVLAASTPGEALRLGKEHAGRIHLLLADVVMPGMNGRELAGSLQAINPQIKNLFMSGYTADLIAHRGVLDEGVHFIEKPFGRKALADKVREVLDHG